MDSYRFVMAMPTQYDDMFGEIFQPELVLGKKGFALIALFRRDAGTRRLVEHL